MAKKQDKNEMAINAILVLILLIVIISFVYHFLNKNLIPPVPTNLKLTSPFGDRNGNFHNGIDIAAPEGTAIKAPADGKATVYFSTLGGNQITIEHTNGLRSGFAHLSKVIINTGDKIKAGQVIGYTGNTGYSTGAHLHFTLFDTVKNQWVNPENYFNYA